MTHSGPAAKKDGAAQQRFVDSPNGTYGTSGWIAESVKLDISEQRAVIAPVFGQLAHTRVSSSCLIIRSPVRGGNPTAAAPRRWQLLSTAHRQLQLRQVAHTGRHLVQCRRCVGELLTHLRIFSAHPFEFDLSH